MKVKITSSCAGENGEHLAEGTTLTVDDELGKALIRSGRAKAIGADEEDEQGGTDEVTELLKKTKAELLDIAAHEKVEVNPASNKNEIAQAIILKRSAAA